MSDHSYFESRTGDLACSPKEVFDFAGDIRNFKRFIPEGTITDWSAEKDSCSFNVSMLGTVKVRINQKDQYTRIVYAGDALKKNDFTVSLVIDGKEDMTARVKVELNAELNPMMKMMATKPIRQFLELLINEMEKFNSWNDTIA
jgi:carbon monoxide dehydrogenase subunit G